MIKLATLLTAAVALSSVAGCSDNLPTSYQVALDPTLQYDVQFEQEITTAIQEWQSQADQYGVKLQLTYTPKGCWQTGEKTHTACITVRPTTLSQLQYWQQHQEINVQVAPNAHLVAVTNTSSDDYQATMFIPTEANIEGTNLDRQQIIIHEMGHAVGLQHSGPKTIMSPTVEQASLHVTCNDIGQYALLRGVSRPDCQ